MRHSLAQLDFLFAQVNLRRLRHHRHPNARRRVVVKPPERQRRLALRHPAHVSVCVHRRNRRIRNREFAYARHVHFVRDHIRAVGVVDLRFDLLRHPFADRQARRRNRHAGVLRVHSHQQTRRQAVARRHRHRRPARPVAVRFAVVVHAQHGRVARRHRQLRHRARPVHAFHHNRKLEHVTRHDPHHVQREADRIRRCEHANLLRGHHALAIFLVCRDPVIGLDEHIGRANFQRGDLARRLVDFEDIRAIRPIAIAEREDRRRIHRSFRRRSHTGAQLVCGNRQMDVFRCLVHRNRAVLIHIVERRNANDTAANAHGGDIAALINRRNVRVGRGISHRTGRIGRQRIANPSDLPHGHRRIANRDRNAARRRAHDNIDARPNAIISREGNRRAAGAAAIELAFGIDLHDAFIVARERHRTGGLNIAGIERIANRALPDLAPADGNGRIVEYDDPRGGGLDGHTAGRHRLPTDDEGDCRFTHALCADQALGVHIDRHSRRIGGDELRVRRRSAAIRH